MCNTGDGLLAQTKCQLCVGPAHQQKVQVQDRGKVCAGTQAPPAQRGEEALQALQALADAIGFWGPLSRQEA